MAMNDDAYVRAAIKLALENARSSRSEAQRLLATQCTQDIRLLLGFAAPHLKAIIAHAIEKTVADPEQASDENANQEKTLAVKATPPPVASARHVAAMETIIGAFRKKAE